MPFSPSLIAGATSPLGWAALGVSAVGGIASGIGAVVDGINQRNANMSEASYNIGQLDLQLDRLWESFRENQAQLETSLDQTLDANNQNIWALGVSQQNNLRISAVSNTENQALMYANLASVKQEGRQAVGNAVQTAAVSGFRNTGSVSGTVIAAEEEASEAYDVAYRQIQLSAYQGFMQAANDYFSANVQLEGYRESSRNAQENFSLQSSMLKSQYQYDKTRTEAERNYWQGIYDSNNLSGWDAFWTGVGDFFGGFF